MHSFIVSWLCTSKLGELIFTLLVNLNRENDAVAYAIRHDTIHVHGMFMFSVVIPGVYPSAISYYNDNYDIHIPLHISHL